MTAAILPQHGPPGPRTLTHLPEHSGRSPLSVHGVTVAYDRKPVLWDVEYEAPDRALIAIVGPNGAGKSTLIKAVLGLVPLASGAVAFWGEPLARRRREIGYVPQRSSVDWDFPVSALEVVAMGRYGMLGWCRPVGRRHREAARACLDQVGLADLADRQISQLSGGQQQRVFLARALAQEARLYFMDEPFAGVDAATETAIVDVLRRLQAEGRTVIVVHHDLQTVADYFDEVLLLNGRVVAAGPVAATFTATNLQTTYGGRLTFLDEVAQALGRRRRQVS
jgi:manganese/zinc/iron transport system ATP- binding protein